MENCIWTIGHSTRSIEDFRMMLQAFDINLIVDVRRFPGSRKFPQFNMTALADYMSVNNIGYKHLEGLGGRRSPRKDSKNTGWRVPAFRGYADYMESEVFKAGISELETLAKAQRVAYMCSESVWWSCHRALISDYLKHKGWTVLHIMSAVRADEHPWTKPARIEDNALVYAAEGSLNL